MLNKIEIMGYLSSDPQLQKIGTKDLLLVKNSIYVPKKKKNPADPTEKAQYEYFNVVFWRENAEKVAKCKEKQLLHILGSLHQNKYIKKEFVNDSKHSVIETTVTKYEIVVQDFKALEPMFAAKKSLAIQTEALKKQASAEFSNELLENIKKEYVLKKNALQIAKDRLYDLKCKVDSGHKERWIFEEMTEAKKALEIAQAEFLIADKNYNAQFEKPPALDHDNLPF